MMWRCVDLTHPFLLLVFLSIFWSAVYAQNDTDGSCKTCPIECIGRHCQRYWWTSMWGFIVTLVALTMDVWGVLKAHHKSTIENIFWTFFTSTVNPLMVLWGMLCNSVDGMAMVANLREAFGDDVIAPLFPWTKSHVKIISSAKIIVNLSPDTYYKIQHLNAFFDKVQVEDLSEALVIGHKKANSKQFNVQLSEHGRLALLRLDVLPPYDELKFLRGNSSLGMAIASAQAIGYIYGVVVRCVQGLRVSPIEAIACILNMVILMKSVLHNFVSLSHRPLLLYLLHNDEVKFVEECQNIQGLEFKGKGRLKLGILIACGILLAMGTYFIHNLRKTLNRVCVVPITLFVVSLILGGIFGFVWESGSHVYVGFSSVCLVIFLNSIGYVWALVVTFKYWKGEEFDIQSSSYLSYVLPYIG